MGAMSIGTPTTPITRPIRCGPAACVRIICPTGMIMPPPRPCRTRKAMSDLARPGQRPRAPSRAEEDDRGDVQALGAEAVGGPAGRGITVARASM